jgi:hypothetical protein
MIPTRPAGPARADYFVSPTPAARVPQDEHAHHFLSVSTKKEVVIIRQMKDSVTWQAGWVNASREAGQDPSVYLSSSVWGATINACVSANVAGPHFWIADGDAPRILPRSPSAVSDTSPSRTSTPIRRW